MNANLIVTCNIETPEPTTPLPTTSPTTAYPTLPTADPTQPTVEPTPFPTHVITNCSTYVNGTLSEYKYCYYEDVYPNTENETITTQYYKMMMKINGFIMMFSIPYKIMIVLTLNLVLNMKKLSHFFSVF